MTNYDPLAADRVGLDEEDLAALGADDPDDMTDMTDDPMVASDYAEPYLAPTDPPVVPGGRDSIEVAQGFAPTSEGADTAGDLPVDDDTITARVQRLLQTDAATSTLNLAVTTRNQVVYLRGVVSSTDDGDLAAAVASRVPTVIDVVDETTVAG